MSDLPYTSFWWYYSLPAPSRYPCYQPVYVRFTSHICSGDITRTPSSLQISLLSCLCQIYLTHLSGDITSSQLPPDILAIISMSALSHTSFWWYNTLPAPSRYPGYHVYVRFTSHIFRVILHAPSSLQISLLPSLCQPYLKHLSGDITRSQLPPDILAIMSMSDLPHTSVLVILFAPSSLQIYLLSCLCQIYLTHLFWWYNTLPALSRYPCYHLYVSLTSHICSGDITRSQLPPDILAIMSMSDLPHTSFWWYYSLPAPSRYPCYHLHVSLT